MFFFVPPIVLSRFLYAHVLINTIILLHAYEFDLHCACGCPGPVICRTFHGHNADANNGGTGGLGRHRGHYDVTVMILMILKLIPLACVDSLPSDGTNYFRQQWLRRTFVPTENYLFPLTSIRSHGQLDIRGNGQLFIPMNTDRAN